MKSNVRLAIVVVGVFFATESHAMDFTRVGDVVIATGEITRGDAHKFANFIHANNMEHMGLGENTTFIKLSSPGGNLFEGMALGEAIREAEFQTVVGKGTICASACALAF